jgi:hypothetical protein
MSKSKKIFLIIAAVFMVIMIIIGWDISRRTTFPGAKSHLRNEVAPGGDK